MSATIINRDVLYRVFNDPRAVAQFEKMQRGVVDITDAATANIAATEALKDAAFVTLSPNAELPNERVLAFAKGLGATVTDTTITLGLTENVARAEGGFSVTFVAEGDTAVSIPLTGTLATREWVNRQAGSGSFVLDDGSAVADGVFTLDDGGA